MSADLKAALVVLDRRVVQMESRLEAIRKRQEVAKNPQWGAYEYDAVAEEMEALKLVLAISKATVTMKTVDS